MQHRRIAPLAILTAAMLHAGVLRAEEAVPAAPAQPTVQDQTLPPPALAVDREKALELAAAEMKRAGMDAEYAVGDVTLMPGRGGAAPRWIVKLTAKPAASPDPQLAPGVQKLPPRMIVTMEGTVSTLAPLVRGGPAGREPAHRGTPADL